MFFVKIFHCVVIGAILNLTISGCIFSPDEKEKKSDHVVLSGSNEQIISALKTQRLVLEDLFKNPGKEKTIEFERNDGEKVLLAMSFNKGDNGQYVNLRNIETLKSVRISLVRVGLKPALNFDFNDGARETHVFWSGANKSVQITPGTLFNEGLQIAAIGLAVWIGAGVAKFVVASIGFLAFNLLMLGVVVSAGSFIISLLESLGVSSEDLIDFLMSVFQSSVEILNGILENTVNIIEDVFSKEPGETRLFF